MSAWTDPPEDRLKMIFTQGFRYAVAFIDGERSEIRGYNSHTSADSFVTDVIEAGGQARIYDEAAYAQPQVSA